MSSDVEAIRCEQLTKTYRIGVGRARLREMFPFPFDRAVAKVFPRWWSRDTFNALEDVSLQVPLGASMGIIGHNGAGKTTLLKVVAGVTAPTSGTMRTTGRIGALIDLLVGFHPDLTGRENAYILGAMHGLGRKAMTARLPAILEFAEIDELADTPVKRYSAGMLARLGFATLVGVEPEILLIDEVLSVGDAAFQRKCIAWFDEYRAGGGTLVFVSHNLGLLRSMTERLVWLDHGRVVDEGSTSRVLANYAQSLGKRPDSVEGGRLRKRRMKERGMHRWGLGGARVEEVDVRHGDGGQEDIEIVMRYESKGLTKGIFCLGFQDEAGREIGATVSPPVFLDPTGGSVRCVVGQPVLRSGIYFPIVVIVSTDGQVHDRWRLDRAIVIARGDEPTGLEDLGAVEIPASWFEA
jgi:ABC-type polysaccharide/polyol phosphate transport system ATPase subunit